MNVLADNKEYRVLARKYRPQKFEDLVGQEILVRILTNSILQNRISHAYLLTGVRGIGKTTSARLIAMSLNCEKRTSESCEPCGQCDPCISVREDRNLDVIEMDAASKTGVDDIREIIDNIKYKPVSNKYKIFIIDEVHMLSKNAFNALLKTLEEPPPHVKFIFATTEVKKIPITIISRCQRFDLHRVNNKDLTAHLINLAKKEKINITNDAIALIVRSADGSVRDGLSLLDQAIVNEDKEISVNAIIQMLGLADRGKIFDLLESIFLGDAPRALEIFNNLHNSGADVLMIFDEMLNLVHFITQIKIAPSLKEDIHIPELERIKGFEMAQKIKMSDLGIVWQVLFKGYEELQSGFHLSQHGEMIILRLIYLHDGPSPDDLIKKSSEIDNKKIIKSEVDKVDKLVSQKTSDASNSEETTDELNQDEFDININLRPSIKITSFRQFVDLFYQKREGMLHTYLYNNVKLINFKEGEINVCFTSIPDKQFSRTIAKLISKWTGRIWQINISDSNVGMSLYEEDIIDQQKKIEHMKNDPEIKSILESLPGTTIHSITNINETVKENDSINDKENIKE
jgi:DNA polymerase-3 subunit gamma/tau